MEERGIIIADRDAEYRKEMADFFESAGYSVETTDSAIHVLCSILEKQTPVLLLGSDFDKKIPAADLVHLLKKCNRNLSVIMVSDQMPLAQVRKVREEGIFYHALKPASSGDAEEIGLAVDCAFKKHEKDADGRQPRQRRTVISDSDDDSGAGPAEKPSRTLFKEMPWLTVLIVLIFGSSYLSLFATETATDGNNTAMWLFLGFCAFIVATQLIPIFLVKLPQRTAAKQETDPLDRFR